LNIYSGKKDRYILSEDTTEMWLFIKVNVYTFGWMKDR